LAERVDPLKDRLGFDGVGKWESNYSTTLHIVKLTFDMEN